MPVEQQVMIIYAANNGFLDDVPVEKVRAAEDKFHLFMSSTTRRSARPSCGSASCPTTRCDDLRAAIDEWKRTSAFKGEVGGRPVRTRPSAAPTKG